MIDLADGAVLLGLTMATVGIGWSLGIPYSLVFLGIMVFLLGLGAYLKK